MKLPACYRCVCWVLFFYEASLTRVVFHFGLLVGSVSELVVIFGFGSSLVIIGVIKVILFVWFVVISFPMDGSYIFFF